MTIREKCFTKATLAKIGHLDSVKEIFATLSETYVRTDWYLEEILMLIQKMRPVDENDHVGLETFYVHILALCTEARALNLCRLSINQPPKKRGHWCKSEPRGPSLPW